MKKLALALLMTFTGAANAALVTGDIAFTSFNADEDGLSFVTFVDIAANTKIYFSDNEFVSGAFNAGESFNSWTSGAATIAAGTVVRFSNFDATTLSASTGTLARETVSGSANWGISTSADTVYAYLAASANATPSAFLAAITNASSFNTTDGSLVGTGLTEGVNAIRLTAKTGASAATPDYAEYTGSRAGEANFAAYKSLVADANNWNVDITNGNYAATIPNTTAFTTAVAAIPEPETYAMFLAGLSLMGFAARRKTK